MDSGSLTTHVSCARGTVDTTNTDPGANRDLDVVSENHNYNGNADVLVPENDPTLPAQSKTFQTRVTNYSDLWVPASTSATIGNTALWLGDDDQDLYVASPLDCLGLPYLNSRST